MSQPNSTATTLRPGKRRTCCLAWGRIEIDRQASGDQKVSVEDSTGHMHASRGVAEPAEKSLLSEVAMHFS